MELDPTLLDNDLLEGIPLDDIRRILDDAGAVVEVDPGTVFIREGEPRDAIYLVLTGEVEVLKTTGQREFVLGRFGPGRAFGDVGLLDPDDRCSASVRTCQAASLLRIDFDRLRSAHPEDPGPGASLRRNAARGLATRLRALNEQNVGWLEERLEDVRRRSEMGRFVVTVLTVVVGYMFAMGLIASLARSLSAPTYIGAPVIFIFAASIAFLIWRSPYPLADFGITWKGARRALIEGVVLTIPILLLTIAAKAILIQRLGLTGRSLFDLGPLKQISFAGFVGAAVGYIAFVPIQEAIVRCGLQASLSMSLTGRRKVPLSIFLSAILFSATHLHMSVTMAALVFPLGLYWGWLFQRSWNLLGVCVSHIYTGIFAFVVVGFDYILFQ